MIFKDGEGKEFILLEDGNTRIEPKHIEFQIHLPTVVIDGQLRPMQDALREHMALAEHWYLRCKALKAELEALRTRMADKAAGIEDGG